MFDKLCWCGGCGLVVQIIWCVDDGYWDIWVDVQGDYVSGDVVVKMYFGIELVGYDIGQIVIYGDFQFDIGIVGQYLFYGGQQDGFGCMFYCGQLDGVGWFVV